jgi:hypothetical protein
VVREVVADTARADRHLPSRCARALPRISPMRDASWWAAEADACIINELARSWSRRSPRAFAVPEFERIGVLHTAALIAAFRRALPTRCGAFADERRIVAGDEGGQAYLRVCAALVASFAGIAWWKGGGRCDSRGWNSNRDRPLHTGALIATFRRDCQPSFTHEHPHALGADAELPGSFRRGEPSLHHPILTLAIYDSAVI